MYIIRIDFNHLRNDEHFAYLREYIANIAFFGAAHLKIEQQFKRLNTAFDREGEAMQKKLKSRFTGMIRRADKIRDRNFRGIAGVMQHLVKHFRPEMADAASRLQMVFNHYGNIANKGIVEKSGAYSNLVHDLQSGTNAADLQLLHVADWVAELAACNSKIFDLNSQRTDELATRTSGVVVEARKEADELCRYINKSIEARLLVNDGDEKYETYRSYIRQLNAVTERYGNLIASRRGRSSNEFND